MSDQRLGMIAGPARAAILLLAVGEAPGGRLLSLMRDDEVREISAAMAGLGVVPRETLNAICQSFSAHMQQAGGIAGSYDVAEKLLRNAMPAERADQILEDIKGPAGKSIWDKLAKVDDQMLANYLLAEHPQTAALVLSRLDSGHAARVLSILPEARTLEVIERMLRIDGVPREVLEDVERSLKADFIVNMGKRAEADPFTRMADIFNAFDRQVEAKLLGEIEVRDAPTAERIRSLMFTFEDLGRLSPSAIQAVLRAAEKDKLPVALKGASDKIKDLFFNNLSERAGKMLRDDIEALGPVRMRDVDAAQLSIIAVTKELAAAGEIEIGPGKEDDLVI